MEPLIHLSPLALVIATLAFFVFGFLWYTPLFGKVWAKEMGFERDKMNVTAGFMVRSLILNFLGNFLLVFVLAHNTQAWDARAWGHELNFVNDTTAAVMSAFFTWLGFFLPQDLNTVTWHMKSWKLFWINTTYHLLSLMLVSFILVFLG